MPAYNAGKYIVKAIESIKIRLFSDWKLVVVDDCSTDDTISIVEEYARKDSKIKLIKRKNNSGRGRLPRFDGIKEAIGDFICAIDSVGEYSFFVDKDATNGVIKISV